MTNARTWIEIVDPNTGRKVDVEVSWHSDWSAIDAGNDQAFWAVSSKIAGILSAAFDGLSDMEETPSEQGWALEAGRQDAANVDFGLTQTERDIIEPVSQGDKDFAQELADAIRDMKVGGAFDKLKESPFEDTP